MPPISVSMITNCHDSQIDRVLRATVAGTHLACSVGVSLAMTKSRRRSSASSRVMNRTFVWRSRAFYEFTRTDSPTPLLRDR
jgi:hypothetical protein